MISKQDPKVPPAAVWPPGGCGQDSSRATGACARKTLVALGLQKARFNQES